MRGGARRRLLQQQQARRQITATLTQAANWELPPTLLRRQSGRELERAVLELRRNGFSDAEIQAYYQTHLDQYKTPEQVQARHILINVPRGADAATEAAAKAKAKGKAKVAA